MRTIITLASSLYRESQKKIIFPFKAAIRAVGQVSVESVDDR